MKQAFAKQNPTPDGRSRRLKVSRWQPLFWRCALLFPFYDLIRFAAGSELYSYILLIPFISGYLVWLKRHNLPLASPPARGTAAAFLMPGRWCSSLTGWFSVPI